MSNAVRPNRHAKRRSRSGGQSLVEFALIFPVLLLLLLVAIDFGRVYLGWVNLQQMVRIAANDAADHATAWQLPDDSAKQAERTKYQERIARDAKQINCRLPGPPPPTPPKIPDPILASGTALGAHVTVGISCEFSILTPIISNVLGGTVLVSAETTFPVKEGVVATVPGGGTPVVVPPVAGFDATPRSGWAPLPVKFTDNSKGSPNSWTWDFSVAAGGTGTGSASTGSALTQGPHTVTYDCAGVPGNTCTFGVSLRVANAGGADTHLVADYITVTVPPPTGPIAEFTGTPLSGLEPLTTTFQFVDVRAGTVTYTKYEWDFTSDGSFDATGLTSVHTYPTSGSYDVTLRVTDSTGATNTLRKNGFVIVQHKVCTVPDFFNVVKTKAQQRWTAAGFTTTVQFLPGGNNYKIKSQTIVGGTIDPQPNGCATVITVGP
jgi:PKD repeat protein